MKNGFIKFTEKNMKMPGVPMVSIKNYKGCKRINFNKSAYKFFQGKSRQIESYFNPRDRIIAVKEIDKKTPTSHSMAVNKVSKSAYVTLNGFFKFFGIRLPDRNLKIEVKWDDQEKILLIPLPKDIEIGFNEETE